MRIIETMVDHFLTSLNEKQNEAVQKPLEPVLVIAGPGTGKTRLITARIAWLIESHKIPAENILALTFTNKAANEMSTRLVNLIGQQGKDVYCSTFHSFALDILRKYHSRLQLNRFFSVCDQEYQHQLLIRLCTPYIKESIDVKVQGILLSFSNFRSRGKALSNFARERNREYENHLKKHHLIDFDQIIIFCQKLLMEHHDVCEEYRHLYPAILVDEFQDSDPLQYDIVRMLAEKDKNIFVVADDDQSIYSWRGANPENIRRYMTDFNIKNPIYLDINYRNGETILNNAQRVIAKTERIEPQKKLIVNEEKSNTIDMKFFYHEKDEVEYILQKIQDWSDQGIPYKEMAIIYPFHKIGQALEQFIIKKEIPYQMALGKSILDHPLVKRIVLHLKLIRDPGDPVNLEELARLELGESLYGLIKQMAQQKRSNFRKILYKFYVEENEKLPYDSLLKIRNFIAHIANLVNLKEFYTFTQMLNEISLEMASKVQSYLFQFREVMDNFSFLEKNASWKKVELEGQNIFVFHNDPRVAFLGVELIKSVFGKKAGSLDSRTGTLSLSGDDILFSLSPRPENVTAINEIPIYTIKSDKRQGSLSNLFKFLQWYSSKDDKPPIRKYVVLDLETTDKDKHTCGIVEIAAVRVEESSIVAEFNSLINPQMPISKGAQKVHNISPEDVKDAPTIETMWPEFLDFIGDAILIAHNGYNFDFPILDRFAKRISGEKLSNIRIDSLVSARYLFPGESNSIDALMQRFNLETDQRHRALDDVMVLVKIMHKLQSLKMDIGQLTSLEMFLDIVALGNYLEDTIIGTEDRLFFVAGGRKVQTAYSKIRSDYVKTFDEDEAFLSSKIKDKLHQLNPRLIAYQNNEHIIEKIKQLAEQYEKMTFDEAVVSFLSYLSLNSAQDQLEDIDAVSLLTYHAAKGLEFDKVILMGMENKNMPGFHALRQDEDDDRPIPKKMEEQRRLFYVGMTRAKSELVLIAVKNRGGWEHESSPFLRDLKI